MRLSLKTKLTLAISLLVLALVAVVSTLYLARLTRQTLKEARDRVAIFSAQIQYQCETALQEAAERGDAPASADPKDLREYISSALDNDSSLNSLIESDMGYARAIDEITITDQDRIVLVSSDSSLRGEKIPVRPSIDSLAGAGFFEQLRELYGPAQTYEFSQQLTVGSQQFGYIPVYIRIGLSSTLMKSEISPELVPAGYLALGSVLISTLLVVLLSHLALAPIARISAQLDRISAGEFDAEPAVERQDELGAVSTKIVGIGRQLRDVREVFSTLRENLDQVMGGLEDGLLLFGADGRAVLVSPSVEKFLDGRPEELRGRSANEIFPSGHPFRMALHIEGDEIGPVEEAEATIETRSGPQRLGISAQVIREHGTRMGTLVTMRDVESRERIGNQLEISERLAALGRVTAGVAHEVKNPLNSMRLWLEVLKVNMPVEPEPQQAVKMLDSEIDRLDRAVKTFLNFTRPVELKLEEADLREVLEGVLDAARPSIRKGGLDLRVEIPPDFPPVLLDRQLIHQAVLNLVLNACDFTNPGGHIALSLVRNGESAIISVADSGRGISPENQKKIFQLFFTTRPGGTGIGLANTFRFVQLHNGRIEFESRAGQGTMFRVELPLARSTEAASAKQEYSQPVAEEKL